MWAFLFATGFMMVLSAPAYADFKLVLLGTGTPFASPHASGPATAVIIDGVPWLVDAGPGVVRRAEAARQAGVEALAQPNLSRVLLTHLHSDHTLGLPDLMYSPWTLDRIEPLQIWGPPGTRKLAHFIEQAYSKDRQVRLEGAEPANETGWRHVTHEITGGVIWQDAALTIEAIPVCHGDWDLAFGFKFSSRGKSVVISGDTTYCPALEQAAKGADIVIHEVYDAEALARRTPEWQKYHSNAHTAAADVGRLATGAKVKKLVLYHQLAFSGSREAIMRQVAGTYAGPVVWGEDLMVFDLDD